MRCPQCQQDTINEDGVCTSCGFNTNATDVTNLENVLPEVVPAQVESENAADITRSEGDIEVPAVEVLEHTTPDTQVTLVQVDISFIPQPDSDAVEQDTAVHPTLPTDDPDDNETVRLVGDRRHSPADDLTRVNPGALGQSSGQDQVDEFEALLQEFHSEIHEHVPQPEAKEPEKKPGKLAGYLREKWKLLLGTVLIIGLIVAVILFLSRDLQQPKLSDLVTTNEGLLVIEPDSQLVLGKTLVTGNLFELSYNGLYFAGVDGSAVTVENIVTGEQYGPHIMDEQVEGLALSPDGAILAVSLVDESLVILDTKNGRTIEEITDLPVLTGRLQFGLQEPILLTVGEGGVIALINAKNGEIIYRETFDRVVVAADVISDMPWVALAFEDGTVAVMDYQLGNQIKSFSVFLQTRAIKLSPSGEKLAVISDGTIALWQVEDQELQWVIGAVPDLQCHFVTERSLVCGAGSYLGSWDMLMGKLVQWTPLDQGSLTHLKYNFTSQEVALSTPSRHVVVYSLQEPPNEWVESASVAALPMSPIPAGTSSRDTDPAKQGGDEQVVIAINPVDRADLVYIPDDRYTVNDLGSAGDQLRSVFLVNYYIYQYEVTRSQYQDCVDAGVCSAPMVTENEPDLLDPLYAYYPAVGVTWFQAADYCNWAGGKLPTEAQWDAGARSGQGIYPWGATVDASRANFCDQNCSGSLSTLNDGFAFLAPVGSFLNGASGFGVYDMAGNVAEWTANRMSGTLLKNSTQALIQEKKFQVVIRGGSWSSPLDELNVNSRIGESPYTFSSAIGFRCVIERVP
jgi:sulfatase modifying factor 1